MSGTQGINYQQAYSYQTSVSAKVQITEETKVAQGAQEEAALAQEKDTVEISGKPAETDSSKQIYKPDMEKVNYLKSVLDGQAETLRKMAEKLMSGQSFASNGLFDTNFKDWVSGQNSSSYLFEMEFSMEFKFDFSMSMTAEVDEATRLEAQELIGEDGPLGINAVTENILGFAKAISGGDPSKIDLLEKAVQKGFDQVSAMFGGFSKLPDVTQKTYDSVMKGFEDWRNESTGNVVTETLEA